MCTSLESEISKADRSSGVRTVTASTREQDLRHGNELPPPLFILAAPRSFTSLACAMLGQHPQMYALPETHLLSYETLEARAKWIGQAAYPLAHGLLRAVAELEFGAQTESTVRKAREWLRLRSHLDTDFVFKILADKVFPRVLVDKSPSLVYRPGALRRIPIKFPEARFIHLVRHPRSHAESVMKCIQEISKYRPLPPTHWLFHLSLYPPAHNSAGRRSENRILDPQNGWYALNKNICTFLASVPAKQWLRVRGEDLLTEPDKVLRTIAVWMGLRADDQAIGSMKHPEQWPYAFVGPAGARYGNDMFFLADPALRPRHDPPQKLDGLLPWLTDSTEFFPEVRLLAQNFGYK